MRNSRSGAGASWADTGRAAGPAACVSRATSKPGQRQLAGESQPDAAGDTSTPMDEEADEFLKETLAADGVLPDSATLLERVRACLATPCSSPRFGSVHESM